MANMMAAMKSATRSSSSVKHAEGRAKCGSEGWERELTWSLSRRRAGALRVGESARRADDRIVGPGRHRIHRRRGRIAHEPDRAGIPAAIVSRLAVGWAHVDLDLHHAGDLRIRDLLLPIPASPHVIEAV